MVKSKVIYDALSITSKIHSTGDFIRMLGLEAVTWQTVKGAHGYQDRLYYDCCSIHFNGTEEMGIWLELTGQGCRVFETLGNGDYEAIFAEVRMNEGEMKITRLDVAADDLDGFLDIEALCEDTRDHEFVSRFNDWQVIEGSKGSSVTHGSMKSDVFLRIYDKARERGYEDGRHWIRSEIQLRRERAQKFALLEGSIGENYAGILVNYLRYIDDDGTDSNKWRLPMKKYWSDFIGAASRISLYEKPGMEYNIQNLEDYVYKQCGNAVDALIKIKGQGLFTTELRRRGTAQNPKYERLIEEYRGREREAL